MLLQIGLVHELREQGGVISGRCRPTRRAVERVGSVARNPRVEESIRRARVETGDHGAALEHRDVGDAAEIEDDAILRVTAEYLVVKYRQERSPLAACGDVAAAEIRDDRDAGHLRERVRIADLPGEGDRQVGPMAQRLPMTADGANRCGADSRRMHQMKRATREGLCHGDVDLADFIQGHAFRSIDEGANPAP